MPGIFGIILKDRSKREHLKVQFDRMGKYLFHFDYYKIETHAGADFMVGQVGLPFRDYPHVRYDEKSSRGMAFDGMMYGWRGERLKGDPARTAPVLNIDFEQFDKIEKVPEYINGSFNTILFDTKKDSFYIANSRLGNRSLYYYQNDELIAFAPETKAFLGIDSFKREVDSKGILDFLNYSFLTCGRTLFNGVKRINPASIIEIQNREMKEPRRYWTYAFNEELDGDIDLLARIFYEKGEEVLERQFGQHDKFMIALSGGMDSRLLAHYCAKSGKHINYYSHGYLKSEDVRIAREVAESLGVTQKYEELEIDPESYAKLGEWTTWLVDGMTFLHCSFLQSVILQYPENPLEFEFLNSQFSGALNFGYGYGSKAFITKNFSYEETLKRASLIYGSSYATNEYYSLFQPDFAKSLRENFYPPIEEELKKHLDFSEYYICRLNRLTMDCKAQRHMNSYDLYRYFYNWHFALIDDEIFEMFVDMPINLSTERALYIKIFCNHVIDLARIRYEKTGVNLFHKPKSSFARNKKIKNLIRHYLGRFSAGKINLYDRSSYVQHDQWYRKYRANRNFFEKVLLDKRTIARGYYNESSVRTLLTKQSRGSSNFVTLSNLATFELFNRYFIDGDDPPRLIR